MTYRGIIIERSNKNMIQNLNEELFSFIKKSPTGFHAVHELANYLTEAGFECLAPREIPGTSLRVENTL